MKKKSDLENILAGVADGSVDIKDALHLLRRRGVEDVGFARIDHGRRERCGFPEVIFAESKQPAQIVVIAKRIVANGEPLLITRLDEAKYKYLKTKLPKLQYNEQARAAYLTRKAPKRQAGLLIVTAGTSDIPVAEEAAVTCETLGYAPERLYDVGVAGIHRLLAQSDKLGQAKVIIVVAGMEGALPSVVGGLVEVPVIAVPTSVGYGTSFAGIAPLLSMLNSCSSGVTVVNIDNGFGAAMASLRILNLLDRKA
jgi:pyridinium-3,5-biscarboxylic acid mononucleotide synthase